MDLHLLILQVNRIERHLRVEEKLQMETLQVLPSVSLISQEVARKASVRQRISSRFRDFGGNEYAHGINGEPSLKSLIASRVKGTQLTRDFSRIVPLYFEIERRLRLNHEENIVVSQLEELWVDM